MVSIGSVKKLLTDTEDNEVNIGLFDPRVQAFGCKISLDYAWQVVCRGGIFAEGVNKHILPF